MSRAAPKPAPKKKRPKPVLPPAVRDAVRGRSGGVCEACGTDRAVHLHHRKLRSQGGQHTEANLIDVSLRCHERIHANRDGRSYDLGLMVHRGDDPALIPVLMFEEAAA